MSTVTKRINLSLSGLLLMAIAGSAAGADYALETSLEYRYFTKPPLDERQYDGDNASIAAIPEAHWDWDDRDQSLTVRLFGRLDEHDDERSHVDVREALYRYTTRDLEWRIGIGQVFWGVTESAHLVDIINQTDFVEDIDGEAKLGQPMVNLAWFTGIGTFDFYFLPYFRERSFPGENGRPRPLLPVDEDAARTDDRTDFALRYYNSFGPLELGLSYFRGTNRDPYFAAEFDNCRVTAAIPDLSPDPLTGTCEEFEEAQESGDIPPNADDFIEELRIDVDNARFVPVYDRIDQLGLDLQYVWGALALKAEAIHRRLRREEDFTAVAAGFEYTLRNLFGSGYDLGLLSEYLHDGRNLIEEDLAVAEDQLSRSGGINFDSIFDALEFRETAEDVENAAVLQADVFAGLRLSLNDLADTKVLVGAIRDLETDAVFASLEASRRFGSAYRVSLEGRLFSEVPVTDPLYGFRDDDYLEITIARFF